MKKVKVTREQAEAIERTKKEQRIAFERDKYLFVDWAEPLNTLSSDDFMDALYEGYEVEPEFKVGDWVVHSNGNIIRQIEKVEHNRVNVTDGENGYVWGISYIRHATPQEIAEEKERRWWKKHGREPWELRIGDVLQNKHTGLVNIIVVTGFEDEKPIFGHGNWHDYKRNYRIVCFAKNRLDVKKR